MTAVRSFVGGELRKQWRVLAVDLGTDILKTNKQNKKQKTKTKKQKKTETNILSGFPLAVKKKLIWEVVQCLTSSTSSASPQSSIVDPPPQPQMPQLLTSASHVQWAMEMIGAGFALPIDDISNISIVAECISVYSAWLLEPNKRPGVLNPAALPLDKPSNDDFIQETWQV